VVFLLLLRFPGRSSRLCVQPGDAVSDSLVARMFLTAVTMVGIYKLVVRFHFEYASVPLYQGSSETQPVLYGSRQTGGYRPVVSLHAVFDLYSHRWV